MSFLSSMSLISWFHDWCLNSVSWSLSFSNRILYFWYSLKILTIARLLLISLLHNICASELFFSSLRISFIVITKIFTLFDDFNIECNHVVSVWRKTIVSLTQFIIELIVQSHDMSRTILLSDCFITFKCNFSQWCLNLKWMSWVSWSISSLLYFMSISSKFCRL